MTPRACFLTLKAALQPVTDLENPIFGVRSHVAVIVFSKQPRWEPIIGIVAGQKTIS
jgi:hypothetical protein